MMVTAKEYEDEEYEDEEYEDEDENEEYEDEEYEDAREWANEAFNFVEDAQERIKWCRYKLEELGNEKPFKDLEKASMMLEKFKESYSAILEKHSL